MPKINGARSLTAFLRALSNVFVSPSTASPAMSSPATSRLFNFNPSFSNLALASSNPAATSSALPARPLPNKSVAIAERSAVLPTLVNASAKNKNCLSGFICATWSRLTPRRSNASLAGPVPLMIASPMLLLIFMRAPFNSSVLTPAIAAAC